MMVREEASLFVLDYPAHQLTADLCKIADQMNARHGFAITAPRKW